MMPKNPTIDVFIIANIDILRHIASVWMLSCCLIFPVMFYDIGQPQGNTHAAAVDLQSNALEHWLCHGCILKCIYISTMHSVMDSIQSYNMTAHCQLLSLLKSLI